MKKILGFLATGCLALGANSASAIPLDVDITASGFSGGWWELSGPTDAASFWSNGTSSWNLDIAPGLYHWEITGAGAGFFPHVSWSLTLDGSEIFSGGAIGLFTFHINEDRRFVAVPEPGTLALLGLGLLGIGFAATRRRDRQGSAQLA